LVHGRYTRRGAESCRQHAGRCDGGISSGRDSNGAAKVKISKHRQRSCDEKDAKGKLCAGHLKRWYDYPKEIEQLLGHQAEIYRCEFCKTLYRPDPEQLPHSFTLRY